MTVDAQATAIEPALFTKFEGDRGKARAIDALKEQRIVLGNTAAAEELYARGEIVNHMPGDRLMAEGDWTESIHFILAGSVNVRISRLQVAERVAGQHVGDMSLIDPSKPRSATVTAITPTVVLVVSENDFTAVAANHSDLWRQIAKELADRLRQRSKYVRVSNDKSHIFIACASESVEVGKAMKRQLESTGAVVQLWTDGVFKVAEHTMDGLGQQLAAMDFAIAIFSPDDRVVSRGEEKSAPRDNTVFELGLFAGAIGRDRSFFVVQKGELIKIPSDLAGITSVRYTTDQYKGLDVAEACESIDARVRDLGPR
ncbi:TIR domain-containing protein [Hyphomicrobiales bacterium]